MMVHALLMTVATIAGEDTALPPRQRLVAILLAIGMLVTILELVRRRRLREEYSVVWVVTAVALLVLAFNYHILVWLTGVIGAAVPNSTLFFGGILFLMLLCLQFSVRLSRLTYRMRKLTRQVALLQEELHELRDGRSDESAQ
ncbi:MAG: DUF2304 domain-containing protein [Planctomycetes bacterium]|nr:DUF2304 domain-containing protein [Planctomycetota bacterium]MCB9892646.1 DUF2304 domain-containing protein [Planctomycetota bacterium]MCB9919363.1 DUF2304 domain-containing protein [Planctomycetota bacterium]